MTTQPAVGKTVANWTPIFANWIQLADVCQLETPSNQRHRVQLASWQVGNAANLPTEPSPCSKRISTQSPVGENSPSYYVGEGTQVPSALRGGLTDRGTPTGPSADGCTILALDIGTRTGWALRGRDGTVSSGTASFQPQRFEGGGMRYLRFKRWLGELAQHAGQLDTVYFEEVRRHAGVDAAHAYGGFLAHLTAWCEQRSVPYQGVPVGTIKKHATGKGNAGKDLVLAAMRARGHHPLDDNEADALALLHWAIATQEV